MTVYVLQRNLTTTRVTLSLVFNVKTSELIRTIEAESWIKARGSIREWEFEYKEGWGYF